MCTPEIAGGKASIPPPCGYVIVDDHCRLTRERRNEGDGIVTIDDSVEPKASYWNYHLLHQYEDTIQQWLGQTGQNRWACQLPADNPFLFKSNTKIVSIQRDPAAPKTLEEIEYEDPPATEGIVDRKFYIIT
mgnify:CR=1 FL=1